MLTIHDRGCELAAADAAAVLIDGRSRSGKSMLTGRLYDPRGHIRITTQLGDGHDVPYLSPGLLAELFDHPHPENPWVIIERRDHHYIQSGFTPGEMVEVEHRRGGPDHHYGAATADRQLAQRVLWGWATGSTDRESALQWAPMDFT